MQRVAKKVKPFGFDRHRENIYNKHKVFEEDWWVSHRSFASKTLCIGARNATHRKSLLHFLCTHYLFLFLFQAQCGQTSFDWSRFVVVVGLLSPLVNFERLAPSAHSSENQDVAHGHHNDRKQHPQNCEHDVVGDAVSPVEDANVRVFTVFKPRPRSVALTCPQGGVQPDKDHVENHQFPREQFRVQRRSADVEVSLEGDGHQGLRRHSATRHDQERVQFADVASERALGVLGGSEADRHDVGRHEQVGDRQVHDEHVTSHAQTLVDADSADDEDVADRAQRRHRCQNPERRVVHHPLQSSRRRN